MRFLLNINYGVDSMNDLFPLLLVLFMGFMVLSIEETERNNQETTITTSLEISDAETENK